jgi:FMN phosphatase YigB (HAD superfamily)
MPVRALFIDIDNTLCREIPDAQPATTFLGQGLLQAMVDFAIDTRGLPREQAEDIVRTVQATLRWWHWTDFIIALDLDAAAFWEFAYARERRSLGPVEPGLHRAMAALKRAGWDLFITSNNPSSGILHKLRLAGLAEIWGSPYFNQYLSPCDLHCMKGEPEFWKRALAHTGLPAAAVTVVGDNPHDDVAAPRMAGIASAVLYAPTPPGQPVPDDVPVAGSWPEIVDVLTGARQGLRESAVA